MIFYPLKHLMTDFMVTNSKTDFVEIHFSDLKKISEIRFVAETSLRAEIGPKISAGCL